MNSNKQIQSESNEKVSILFLIGLIGFIFTAIALFNNIHSVDNSSIWISLIVTVIILVAALFVWSVIFSFLGFIPILAVVWVLLGVLLLCLAPFYLFGFLGST